MSVSCLTSNALTVISPSTGCFADRGGEAVKKTGLIHPWCLGNIFADYNMIFTDKVRGGLFPLEA